MTQNEDSSVDPTGSSDDFQLDRWDDDGGAFCPERNNDEIEHTVNPE
jgi:hypothetical protein